MREKIEIYPHGKMGEHALDGVEGRVEGYLLALQYKNAVSLGAALRSLRGILYLLPPGNERAVIWLSAAAVSRLPQDLASRLIYLAEFEIDEAKRPCDKCKRSDVLYACGKFGHPLRLICLKCSRFASATNANALAAREEAERHKDVLRKFRPIRKLAKPRYKLLKAA